MRWYHWILLVLVIIPVTIVAFALGRRGMDLSSSVSTEMDRLEARAVAKKWQIKLGAVEAEKKVRERHAERLAKLDEENLREVEALSGDPVALADLLARLSG